MNLSNHRSNWVAPPEHSWEADELQLTVDIPALPLAQVQVFGIGIGKGQSLLVSIKQECFSPWDPVSLSTLFIKGNRELPMTMQKPAQLLETVYHSSQSMVVTNGISRWEIRTEFYPDIKGYFLVTCDLSCFITFLLSWFFADFLQAQRTFWLLSPQTLSSFSHL